MGVPAPVTLNFELTLPTIQIGSGDIVSKCVRNQANPAYPVCQVGPSTFFQKRPTCRYDSLLAGITYHSKRRVVVFRCSSKQHRLALLGAEHATKRLLHWRRQELWPELSRHCYCAEPSWRGIKDDRTDEFPRDFGLVVWKRLASGRCAHRDTIARQPPVIDEPALRVKEAARRKDAARWCGPVGVL